MYISMTPVAAAGATILGVELISSSSPTVASTVASTGAATGAGSPLLTLAGFLLIAMALVAVAWTAKHPKHPRR